MVGDWTLPSVEVGDAAEDAGDAEDSMECVHSATRMGRTSRVIHCEYRTGSQPFLSTIGRSSKR